MSSESLSSCLSRLSAAAENPAGLGRVLSELRSRHVSRAGGAGLFRRKGGLALLLELFTVPVRAAALGSSRRNLELALSLLANSCTEPGSRVQVRQLGGIPALVCILQSVCADSIWNRVSRALGNLAQDAQNNVIIHESGAISTLVQILESSQDGGCVQSCLRALRILGDSTPHRVSICQQGGLSPCVPLLTSADPDVVCAAARALCELSRGCSLDCAEQLAPVVPTLMTLAQAPEVKAPVRQAALGTLCNLCSQGALRPTLGNAGAIQLLIAEVRVLQEAPARCLPVLRALCLCCREALNRLRVRELGGLELLLDLLRSPQYRSFHHRITVALLHFCHDTAALAVLAAGGLAPLLAGRLEEMACAAEQSEGLQTSRKMEDEEKGSASFDFPAEVKSGRDRSVSSDESFRSWLLSEGYIGSLDDLPAELFLDRENQSEKSSRVAQDGLCPSPVPSHVTQEISAPPCPLGPRAPPPSEVWAPEYPLLLLLSCFSHLSDCSSHLVSHQVLSGLLTYVTCHPHPSVRAGRLLQRLTCDPSCLEDFIQTGSICTLRARLLLSELPDHVKGARTRVPERAKLLGRVLLRNLRIQAESAFGVGVVTHMLVSGSQGARQQCALCLPFLYRKQSPQRQHLLGEALRLVLGMLTVSVDPVSFFHASECLSSVLAPDVLPGPALTPSLISGKCAYLDLLAVGRGDMVFLLDDGGPVLGSRELLSRGCEVFQAMLQGGYAESQQMEVRVREVPSCAFLPLLHYLHGCSMEHGCSTLQGLQCMVPGEELAQSPIASTLAAAGRFLLPGLQKVLENTVRDFLLSLENLPTVYCFAETHESARLQQDCCVYLLRRTHPPRKRAQTLLQLCERAQDKQRLTRHLEDVVQERSQAP